MLKKFWMLLVELEASRSCNFMQDYPSSPFFSESARRLDFAVLVVDSLQRVPVFEDEVSGPHHLDFRLAVLILVEEGFGQVADIVASHLRILYLSAYL